MSRPPPSRMEGRGVVLSKKKKMINEKEWGRAQMSGLTLPQACPVNSLEPRVGLDLRRSIFAQSVVFSTNEPFFS